jgi:hypothetical protein
VAPQVGSDVTSLWEAHHGEPYATHFLVAEAFEDMGHPVAVRAATLRERLPQALRLADKRARRIYGIAKPEDIGWLLRRFEQFVEVCERIERDSGLPVDISATS